MANVLPHLDPDDRPWLWSTPSPSSHATPWATRPASRSRRSSRRVSREERLAAWYRRFVDTRSVDAAERTLATAVAAVRAGRPSPRRCSWRQLPITSSSTRATRSTSPTRPLRRWPTPAPSRPRRCSPPWWRRRAGPIAPRSRRSGGTPSTSSGLVERATPPLLAAVDEGAGTTVQRRRHARLGAPGGRSRGRRRGDSRGRRRREPRPSSWAGRWPSRPPCASPASTSRTTTVTGTRSTTPSPPPTDSTRRSPARRRPSCCGGVLHGALRVYLDRFLNVPAARLPEADAGDIGELDEVLGRPGRRRPSRRHRGGLPARRRLTLCC